MAGNELKTIEFLVLNAGKISLKHLGLIEKIGAPNSKGGFVSISSIQELELVSTEDSSKKADIYINGRGVSLKQSGSSFSFNRLQRAELLDVFCYLGFTDPEKKIEKLDKEIDNFHKGFKKNRNIPWKNIFNESDFKRLLDFLMTKGSPNQGYSSHPAELVLEAPSAYITKNNISVFTFNEYFESFRDNLFIAIRRQWIGQSSNSEHQRAMGLAQKVGNKKWVYDTISGEPRISKLTGKRWRDDIAENQRKTVYIIFIEKK